MISSGRKATALNPGEESLLLSIRDSLQNSKPIPPKSIDLVVRILTDWPYSDRLAGLDILRCIAKYHTVALYSTQSRGTLVDVAMSASLPKDEKPVENAVMMGVRVIVNAFASAEGRSLVKAHSEGVLSFLERILGLGTGDAIGKFNRNILIAVSTAVLNLSVLVGRENLLSAPERRRLLNITGAILAEQNDSEVLYRSLVALGTILTVASDIAKASEVKAWIQPALSNAAEERVRNVARECAQLVKL